MYRAFGVWAWHSPHRAVRSWRSPCITCHTVTPFMVHIPRGNSAHYHVAAPGVCIMSASLTAECPHPARLGISMSGISHNIATVLLSAHPPFHTPFNSKFLCTPSRISFPSSGSCSGVIPYRLAISAFTLSWHSNDSKYRETIWQCNSKFKDKTRCKTPHLTEDEIKVAFITALNKEII